MGSAACHDQVVQPSSVSVPSRTPLEIASSPFGTVAETLTDAASRGWSLEGNQVAATSGSPATIAPSSVCMKPEVPRSSWMVSGTPSYRTTVVNSLDFRSESSGVTVSSPASRLQSASSPSTAMDRTVRPSKSRLKLDRCWVATAWMVATPVRTSVAGSYVTSRS
jgi:hypothetical protein